MNDYSTPPSAAEHSRLSVAEKDLPAETIRAQRRPEAGGPQPLHHIGWGMEPHCKGGWRQHLDVRAGIMKRFFCRNSVGNKETIVLIIL